MTKKKRDSISDAENARIFFQMPSAIKEKALIHLMEKHHGKKGELCQRTEGMG